MRFFDLPFAERAKLVIKLLSIEKPFVISVDRTDWYLGETPLNILMLSLVYKQIAFPLRWIVLEKKGLSNTEERIELLERYLKIFSKDSICFVTADREFIGRDWFRYLKRKSIPFRIRTRENLKVENSRRNKTVKVKNLFRNTKAGVASLLSGKRRVLVEEMFLMGVRTFDGESMLLKRIIYAELCRIE